MEYSQDGPQGVRATLVQYLLARQDAGIVPGLLSLRILCVQWSDSHEPPFFPPELQNTWPDEEKPAESGLVCSSKINRGLKSELDHH